VRSLRRRLAAGGWAAEHDDVAAAADDSQSGPTVLVLYGSTEAGGACACTTAGGDGLVGKVVAGAGVRIVDAAGRDVQAGAAGEIIVRTPYAAAGYWKDRKETERVFRNGFVHTGDLGRFNSANELCVLGRLKEVIIQGGQNVVPEEIARVI